MDVTVERPEFDMTRLSGCHFVVEPAQALRHSRLRIAEIFRNSPDTAELERGGNAFAGDRFEAGGDPIQMTGLWAHGDGRANVATLTGRTLAENAHHIENNPDEDVIRPADESITGTGGPVGLRGNRALEGAVVKVAGLAKRNSCGPMRCFDSEEACFEVVTDRNSSKVHGDIVGVDARLGMPDVRLSDDELAKLAREWKLRLTDRWPGANGKYAETAGSALMRAVAGAGGAKEACGYAYI